MALAFLASLVIIVVLHSTTVASSTTPAQFYPTGTHALADGEDALYFSNEEKISVPPPLRAAAPLPGDASCRFTLWKSKKKKRVGEVIVGYLFEFVHPNASASSVSTPCTHPGISNPSST
jgi:hypothetical protein